MPRRTGWQSTVTAARNEALLAVRLYNESGEPRAFEGFVVHMHVAWLYLLHARFTRDGVEFRYRDRTNPRRFVRVDGEHKRWELGRCVEERWPNGDDPTRKNLEFFIALRNRIEHRHAGAGQNLALSVAGHAQALLLNFETELVDSFGQPSSLATSLRFPVFVGSFTTDGADALRKLRSQLAPDLRRFIGEFHSGLAVDVATNPRFELRLRVVLEQVQRDPDALSIQFTRWDEMTDEQKSLVEELGRRGQTVIRERRRPVAGHGLLRPQEAERLVADAVPFEFNSNHFLRARRAKGIRPPMGDPHPERTDEKYCVYNELSASYGYTAAWVKYLIRECSSEQGFKDTTGRDPRRKA